MLCACKMIGYHNKYSIIMENVCNASPKKCFKDCVKYNLKYTRMDVVLQTGCLQWRNDAVHLRSSSSSMLSLSMLHVKALTSTRPMKWRCGSAKYADVSYCQRQVTSLIRNHIHVQIQSRYTPLLPSQPENTCVICNKLCMTAPGLKRRGSADVILQTSQVNPLKML